VRHPIDKAGGIDGRIFPHQIGPELQRGFKGRVDLQRTLDGDLPIGALGRVVELAITGVTGTGIVQRAELSWATSGSCSSIRI